MNGAVGFRIDAGLEGTRIYARRPGRRDPGAAVMKLGLILFVGSLLGLGFSTEPQYQWAFGPAVGAVGATLGVILAGVVWRRVRPPDPQEYEILLDARGVSVDGVRMEHDVKMTLHAEKLVFRDSVRQIEVWHGVRDLDERMELRTILERALDASSERHGEGAAAVPQQLRERQPG